MNTPKVPYVCPRCTYSSSRKSNLSNHFNSKKMCPNLNNVILTSELKMQALNRDIVINTNTRPIEATTTQPSPNSTMTNNPTHSHVDASYNTHNNINTTSSTNSHNNFTDSTSFTDSHDTTSSISNSHNTNVSATINQNQNQNDMRQYNIISDSIALIAPSELYNLLVTHLEPNDHVHRQKETLSGRIGSMTSKTKEKLNDSIGSQHSGKLMSILDKEGLMNICASCLDRHNHEYTDEKQKLLNMITFYDQTQFKIELYDGNRWIKFHSLDFVRYLVTLFASYFHAFEIYLAREYSGYAERAYRPCVKRLLTDLYQLFTAFQIEPHVRYMTDDEILNSNKKNPTEYLIDPQNDTNVNRCMDVYYDSQNYPDTNMIETLEDFESFMDICTNDVSLANTKFLIDLFVKQMLSDEVFSLKVEEYKKRIKYDELIANKLKREERRQRQVDTSKEYRISYVAHSGCKIPFDRKVDEIDG